MNDDNQNINNEESTEIPEPEVETPEETEAPEEELPVEQAGLLEEPEVESDNTEAQEESQEEAPAEEETPAQEETNEETPEEPEASEEAPEEEESNEETPAEDFEEPENSQDEIEENNQQDSSVEQPEEASTASEPVAEQAAVADDQALDDTQPQAQPEPVAPTNDNPNAKWYVVHTYSGHENKVAATLKQRVESEHLENKIFEVLVPMQDKIEIKGGKKAEVKEKIFPGYILVKMELEDNTWLVVRTTQGVTSFVGMGNKPTAIPDSEVQSIIKFTQIQQPTFKQVFTMGDTVKIVDGPFAEFIGKVDNVDEEKGKVKVLVSIFGRETPVELDFLQVQKI